MSKAAQKNEPIPFPLVGGWVYLLCGVCHGWPFRWKLRRDNGKSKSWRINAPSRRDWTTRKLNACWPKATTKIISNGSRGIKLDFSYPNERIPCGCLRRG